MVVVEQALDQFFALVRGALESVAPLRRGLLNDRPREPGERSTDRCLEPGVLFEDCAEQCRT